MTETEAWQAELRTVGFCILPDVIPSGERDRVRASVLTTVQREAGTHPSPQGVGFIPSLLNHDHSFVHHLANARLLKLLESLLGRHLRISFTSAIVNYPGNVRGKWHADWPFNQHNASHIPAPYLDACVHVTTLWMLSPFSAENGGTLIVPGSHRSPTNPTATECGVELATPFLGELNVEGDAGSVLVMDSRLWHATAPNQSTEPRIALAVRYAPWWLNLETLRPESPQRRRILEESGHTGVEVEVPSLHRDVWEQLPEELRPLYQHWLGNEK